MNRAYWGVLALFLLSACGGGAGSGGLSSGASSLLPSTVAQSASIAATTTSSVSAAGTIASLFSGGFTLNAGGSVGYIHVYVTASTTISGPTPFAGESVSVTGTGSLSTSISATTVSQRSTQVSGTPAPIATPSLISTQGPVTRTATNEFQINSGYPHGYLWVHTSSATTFIGSAPAAGTYAQISGTGSLSATFNAVVVTTWSSAPTQTDPTGTIVAGTPYGFTLDVSSTEPAVPIVLNSSTVVGGGTLEAGATASVTGIGATTGSITATSIVVTDPTPVPSPNATPTPTPAPIAQTHVLTSDYLGGINGTTKVAWASAAPYLTWAQTSVADANAISATGIKTQVYTDPNRVETTDPLYAKLPSTAFAQTCSGVDVTDYFDNVTQYVTNPASTALQSAYAALVKSQIGTAHFDAIFQDDNGPLSEFTSGFSPSLPCNYTDASWLTGGNALDNAAPLPVIANGLSGLDGESPSLAVGLMSSSNTIGGNYEGCYTYVGDAENNGWLWQTEENTELQVNAANKMFSCQERNTADASSNVAARIYAYASFLLTYNPTTDVLWEAFATSDGFHVFPEEQLVALDPATPTPTSIAALVQPGGAYGRLYNECYVKGVFVGPCGVAVNSNTNGPAPFPYPQFQHSLTLSGYDVLGGGTLSTQGAAPPSSLAPTQAVIAFP